MGGEECVSVSEWLVGYLVRGWGLFLDRIVGWDGTGWVE
jgi:hypothetical protein